jgi:catechol 2,3-dioxygenase-like lactoylglutathione lyase family enzyme
VTVGVTDLARAVAFYDPALGAIGISRLYTELDIYVGYGVGKKAFFWIGLRPSVTSGAHVDFAVAERDLVDRFHVAGLAAGGTDNGLPGLRPHYHARYYGAFLLDPDGHNIEAVCHV